MKKLTLKTFLFTISGRLERFVARAESKGAEYHLLVPESKYEEGHRLYLNGRLLLLTRWKPFESWQRDLMYVGPVRETAKQMLNSDFASAVCSVGITHESSEIPNNMLVSDFASYSSGVPSAKELDLLFRWLTGEVDRHYVMENYYK